MRVGFLQFYPRLFEEQKNLHRIDKLLTDVNADLIVLPELATSGYLFANKDEMKYLSASAKQSRIADFFRNIAKRENIAIVVGILEQDKEIYYNSSILVYPDGKIELYRKTHLFYKEKLLFAPGNTGFNVFNYQEVKLGLMICFDWIFPESARILALKGADVICHSANLVMPYCQKAMYARAIENNVFIITANRIGSDKNRSSELYFTGASQIMSPKGEILASASIDKEEIRIVDIDPQEARNKNINEYNHLFKDRRTDLYSELSTYRFSQKNE
ncbi:MAG: hypothetical protein DRH57_00780 [Candidatus Cloacimonadota bacterium]|nr:MAG: hypothetical protein DRH57_00780 [Candidatus Cloacimonadota bacterium]